MIGAQKVVGHNACKPIHLINRFARIALLKGLISSPDKRCEKIKDTCLLQRRSKKFHQLLESPLRLRLVVNRAV